MSLSDTYYCAFDLRLLKNDAIKLNKDMWDRNK